MMVNTIYIQNAYRNVSVNTSTPLDLVIMLYDVALDNLKKALLYMNQRKVSQKVNHISKVMAIIDELLKSLDMEVGGEISFNLRDLYIHILKELTIANLKNDEKRVEHVHALLKELKSAWEIIRGL
jgi:flagellar protein FliS